MYRPNCTEHDEGLVQGASVALGLQSKFDWRSVAISAVAAPLSQYAGTKVAGWFGGQAALEAGGYNWTKFARDATSNLTTAGVRSAFGGKFDVNQVVADVFGNALANSIVDETILSSKARGFAEAAGLEFDRRDHRATYEVARNLARFDLSLDDARKLATDFYRAGRNASAFTAEKQGALVNRTLTAFGAGDQDRVTVMKLLKESRAGSMMPGGQAATSRLGSGADEIEEIVVTARRTGSGEQSALGRFVNDWQDPLATAGRMGQRLGDYTAENSLFRFGLTALEAITSPALFAGRRLFESTELG